MKRKIWKVIRWIAYLGVGYFIIIILFFGHSAVDEKQGIYTFYWSGLNAILDHDKEFGFSNKKIVETKLDGADGPYLIGDTSYTINEHNKLSATPVSVGAPVEVVINHPAIKSFIVTRKILHRPESQIYPAPKKLVAISDIEGNFGGFYSFLFNNKIIDQKGTWIFGNGHLVLNGDFVDRGKQVLPVLWLIYNLEQQAEAAGGKVHFILGNHEIMMMQGNVSYAHAKYIEASKQISRKTYWNEAMRYLYAENTELGKWLRTKNVIEKIGSSIFVHAGLNIEHVHAGLTINKFNKIAGAHYGIPNPSTYADNQVRLTVSAAGPYWDRGLAMDITHKILFWYNGINPTETTQQQLNHILKYYQASKIIIGHSVVDDIQADYQQKVIKIDVRHGEQMKSGKTKGISMENGKVFKVDDQGTKRSI